MLPKAVQALHYQRRVYRLIETQEATATLHLVDDLTEQFQLEQMLDQVKPAYRQGTEHLHYLLKTPFRYPPLRHGSRFGSRQMPGIFYASEHTQTCLAEVAYYRLLFLQDMLTPYLKPVHSEHMLFQLQLLTTKATDLTLPPVAHLHAQLTDKRYYGFTQQLGQWLAEHQCSVIRYRSARSDGVNIAILQPDAIHSTSPEQSEQWFCQSSEQAVLFRLKNSSSAPIRFEREAFLVDGVLPRPA